MVLLLSQEDNFLKLITAGKTPTACYYSNGCRRADTLHGSGANPPSSGSSCGGLCSKQPSIPEQWHFSTLPFSFPTGLELFGTEVWGKGNLLYPAPSHNAILGKPAISSYLRKLSLGLGWFFFPFCPPQMGTLGFYLDRNQSNVSQGRWATAKIGWMRGSVQYSCKKDRKKEGRTED